MPKTLMCDPALFERDLKDQVIIITGSNSGIGKVAAEQLIKQGAHVILACRRVEEAQALVKDLGEVSGQGTVMRLDLADLSSVRAFAKQFKEQFSRLDVLLNNAGVMNTPEKKTKDGFEMQLGVNHLGHFLLTELLLDVLKASAPSRIVNVSSCFHDKAMGKKGHIVLDDLNFEKRTYNGWSSYAQSKLANVLHAKELARRLEGTGVTAVSLHPGWVRTNLARHSMPVWVQNTILRPILGWMGMIGPWEGTQTTFHCVLAPDVPEHNGAFFSQVGIYSDKSANKGGWPLKSPNAEVHEQQLAKEFYEKSIQMVGLEG
ncbi:MAG: SDR family oxidoreductase [Myxococcota bacterium]